MCGLEKPDDLAVACLGLHQAPAMPTPQGALPCFLWSRGPQ